MGTMIREGILYTKSGIAKAKAIAVKNMAVARGLHSGYNKKSDTHRGIRMQIHGILQRLIYSQLPPGIGGRRQRRKSYEAMYGCG